MPISQSSPKRGLFTCFKNCCLRVRLLIQHISILSWLQYSQNRVAEEHYSLSRLPVCPWKEAHLVPWIAPVILGAHPFISWLWWLCGAFSSWSHRTVSNKETVVLNWLSLGAQCRGSRERHLFPSLSLKEVYLSALEATA